MSELPQGGHLRTLGHDEVLWSQGDPPSGVVVVESGELDLFEESLDGDLIILHTVGPGSLLGEMSTLDGRPHSASIRARGVCRLRWLSGEEFLAALRSQPDFAVELLRRQSKRVRRLSTSLARVGLQPVLNRLVHVLLMRAEPGTVELSVTHHELAARIATTRESVTKALRILAANGLVRTERGKIVLLDRAALTTLLGED